MLFVSSDKLVPERVELSRSLRTPVLKTGASAIPPRDHLVALPGIEPDSASYKEAALSVELQGHS